MLWNGGETGRELFMELSSQYLDILREIRNHQPGLQVSKETPIRYIPRVQVRSQYAQNVSLGEENSRNLLPALSPSLQLTSFQDPI